MDIQRNRTQKDVFSRRLPSEVVSISRAVFQGLGTHVASKMLRDLDSGRFLSVVKGSIRAEEYDNSESFRRDYLAVSLLSKFKHFDLGFDLEGQALADFVERERSCSAAALQLKETLRYGSLRTPYTLHSIFHTAREKIARLLGPFSWDEAEPHFAFGPGATFTRPHCEGDPYYKYRAKPCSTYGCAMLSYTVLRRVPLWYHHVVSLTGKSVEELDSLPLSERVMELFTLVHGNRVTFVPKSATKCRTIAIEPTMNGFIQHGIGEMISRRLRRVGVDVRNQRKNQQMAQLGSLDGSLATLDLSAASDSVSLELCQQLLPSDWFEAICLTRSPVGTLPDGTLIRYSKVSSMGNGYTFPLESLVFWALCAAVADLFQLADRRFTVYGDDIIFPTVGVHSLIWVLEASGFTLNPDKSFRSGPFRESCGKHFFRGDDVTPFYVRDDVDTVPRITWFANQIRRWSRLTWGLDPSMHGAYDFCRSLLPRRLRVPSIPDGMGDTMLFGDLDEVRPSRDRHCDGWKCSAWVPIVKTREFSDAPFLIRQLGSGTTSKDVETWAEYIRIARIGGWLGKSVRLVDDAFRVIPRMRNPRWYRVNGIATDWPSYGPWLD